MRKKNCVTKLAVLIVISSVAVGTSTAQAAYNPCVGLPTASGEGAWFKGRGTTYYPNETLRGIRGSIETYNPHTVNNSTSSAWLMLHNAAGGSGDDASHYAQMGWLKAEESPWPLQATVFSEIWDQYAMTWRRNYYVNISVNGGDSYHAYQVRTETGGTKWYFDFDGANQEILASSKYYYQVDEVQAGGEVHNQPSTAVLAGDQMTGDRTEWTGFRSLDKRNSALVWQDVDLEGGLLPEKSWHARKTYTNAAGNRDAFDIYDTRCPA